MLRYGSRPDLETCYGVVLENALGPMYQREAHMWRKETLKLVSLLELCTFVFQLKFCSSFLRLTGRFVCSRKRLCSLVLRRQRCSFVLRMH